MLDVTIMKDSVPILDTSLEIRSNYQMTLRILKITTKLLSS